MLLSYVCLTWFHFKVDVDANEETSSACNVTCMPTFQFYKNGAKLGEFSGADEKKLRDTITSYAA
jgi:thioredoxin 1